jgi:hypothetical protein
MDKQRAREIEDLDESSIDVNKVTYNSAESKQLWAKNELIFRNLCDFWRPSYEDGKKCMNYLLGKIFDENVRAYYENVQQKVCIEPRVMKPRINTIVGQISQARRSGKITAEAGAMSATDAYRANVIMKFLEKELKEQYFLDQMLFRACATGCPQVMRFDMAETSFGEPTCGITAELDPWDASLLSPFNQPDGSDVTEYIWMSRQSKSQMMDENPDKDDEIKEFYARMLTHSGDYTALVSDLDGLTLEDSRYLYYDIVTGLNNTKMDGRALVLERWFITKVKHEVAISMVPQSVEVLDYHILPKDWDKERKKLWLAQHPEYRLIRKDVKVLWRTRWTREGLNLLNEIHWFQEANNRGLPIMPIGVFVPQLIDGVPSGPGPDLRPLVLMNAISETEYLHDIRMGGNDLLAYMKGTVVNSNDLPGELSQPQGIAIIDPEKAPAGIDQAIKFLQRRPNEKFGEYSQKIKADMVDTDLVTPSLMGQQPIGESGKAKALNIGQGIMAYSFMAANYNASYARIKDLECMLVPYAFTEEQVIQIFDEDMMDDSKPILVNQIVYDIDGNRTVNPATDLSGIRWRWRITDGDDSPTARMQELNEMLIFWNTTAPTLIEADPSLSLLSSVLISMKNNTAKEIGRVIAQKAAVQAQQMSQQQMMQAMAELEEKRGKADADRLKAARSGFSFSITPEDLVMYPQMYQMLVSSNYINPQTSAFQLPPAPAAAASAMGMAA